MARVFIIRREPRRVCALGDLGADDLLEGVDSLARCVDGVHEMHVCCLTSVRTTILLGRISSLKRNFGEGAVPVCELDWGR